MLFRAQLEQLEIEFVHVPQGDAHAWHNPVVDALMITVPFGHTDTHVEFRR
jgi:hypothetical protein